MQYCFWPRGEIKEADRIKKVIFPPRRGAE
jgi:hypothetical protein